MKFSLTTIMLLVSMMCSSATSCEKTDNRMNEKIDSMENGQINIIVNAQTFTATLLDNNSAKAFKEMLPLAINMTELNRNEKYYDLPQGLPTQPSNPNTIKNGDLMLYGSRTLVLFYKTFSTSYHYTRLGTVDNATGLASALGTENVTVTFELKN